LTRELLSDIGEESKAADVWIEIDSEAPGRQAMTGRPCDSCPLTRPVCFAVFIRAGQGVKRVRTSI
jgi:hypothetical protein